MEIFDVKGPEKVIRGGIFFFFFFQAEDGIRSSVASRGLGDVYKRQGLRILLRRLMDLRIRRLASASPVVHRDCRHGTPGTGSAKKSEYAHGP